jgi:hypothetical protein
MADDSAPPEESKAKAVPPAMRPPRVWHPGKQAGPGQVTNRGLRIFLLLAAALAILGIVIGLIVIPQRFRQPYFRSLIITEYKNPHWPVNSLARQDSDLLSVRFQSEKSQRTTQAKEEVLREIARPSPADDRPLVIHWQAHACTDGNEVYLLPATAEPGDKESWIRLSEALEKLCNAAARRPKLLLLDIAHPLADPHLGILSDDVADRIKQALDRLADRGLLVFCSCSPGEVSLVMEDQDCSAFAYYLDLGLSGEAQDYPERKQDHLKVRNLEKYVADHVARWAQKSRGRSQTPVLYGEGDFELLQLPRERPTPPPPKSIPVYPDELTGRWVQRGEKFRNGVYRRAPLALARLDANLLRIEKRWRGGEALTSMDTELAKIREIDDGLKKTVDNTRAVNLAHSLAWAPDAGRGAPDAALEKELRNWLNEPPADKPAAEPTKKEPVARKASEALEKLKKSGVALARAALIVAVEESHLSDEKLLDLSSLLSKHPDMPRYVETAYFSRIAEARKEDSERWQPDTAQQLLRVVREAENALRVRPEALPAVQGLVNSAGSLRRDSEKLLFSPDSTAEPISAKLKEAENMYIVAARLAAAFEEADAAYDKALSFLPAALPYVVNRAEIDSRAEDNFRAAIKKSVELGEELDRSLKGTNDKNEATTRTEKLVEKCQELNTLLEGSRGASASEGLLRPFRKEVVTLLLSEKEQEKAPVRTYWEIQRLLDTPLVDGTQRIELWKAEWGLSRKLHEQTAKLDQEDKDKRRRPKIGSARPSVDERRYAIRLARLSLELVRLGGGDVVTKLDELETKLDRVALNGSEVVDLGEAVRKLELRELDEFSSRVRAERLLLADRLGRILDPLDMAIYLDSRLEPRMQLDRRRTEQYWTWLREQYKQEANVPGNGEELGTLYSRMAEQITDMAKN